MLLKTSPQAQRNNLLLRTVRDTPRENPEETLVVDRRDGVPPAQQVEQKLMILLQHAALPVSCLHMLALRSSRRHC